MIDLSVSAYYETATGYGNQLTSAAVVNAVAAAFGGVSGAGGEAGQIFDAVEDGVLGLAPNKTGDDDWPSAFLNYLVFDENYNYLATGSGFKRVNENDAFNSHTLTHTVNIAEAGYLYIYVSNESSGTTNVVFFDDLDVTHKGVHVRQTDSFYPFGLTHSGVAKNTITPTVNPHKRVYNGGSEWQDELGYDVYSTYFREYDPAIGRFSAVDVEATQFTSWSPYVYSFNDPVYWNDPLGDCAVCLFSDNHVNDAGTTGATAGSWQDDLSLATSNVNALATRNTNDQAREMLGLDGASEQQKFGFGTRVGYRLAIEGAGHAIASIQNGKSLNDLGLRYDKTLCYACGEFAGQENGINYYYNEYFDRLAAIGIAANDLILYFMLENFNPNLTKGLRNPNAGTFGREGDFITDQTGTFSYNTTTKRLHFDGEGQGIVTGNSIVGKFHDTTFKIDVNLSGNSLEITSYLNNTSYDWNFLFPVFVPTNYAVRLMATVGHYHRTIVGAKQSGVPQVTQTNYFKQVGFLGLQRTDLDHLNVIKTTGN